MGLRRLLKNAYNNHNYKKSIDRTRDVDYFNYEELIRHQFNPCGVPNSQNLFYGHNLAIDIMVISQRSRRH